MTQSNAQTIEPTQFQEQAMAQYLTFCLAGEEYGINILKVQEIKGWSEVTPMPNTPDFILGVINLRGTVVPIVDLRTHFGMPAQPPGPTTVVIVVRTRDTQDTQRTMGIVVDAVSEVRNIAESDVQPPPPIEESGGRRAVAGLAAQEEHMIIILDIDDLMINGVLRQMEQDLPS
jgi:purine-binding chemotaxis protein CheW